MFPPLPELLLLYTLEKWVLFQRCCYVEGKCCVKPTSTNIIDNFDVYTVKLYDKLFRKCMCWKIRKSLRSFKIPPYVTFIRVRRERRGVKKIHRNSGSSVHTKRTDPLYLYSQTCRRMSASNESQVWCHTVGMPCKAISLRQSRAQSVKEVFVLPVKGVCVSAVC